ncbi:MAG: hypothetical protein JXK08_09845 [Flavobacteriaceae bacterium]|nr:hypothetical protein [Flavobacteriaceae bacterium]
MKLIFSFYVLFIPLLISCKDNNISFIDKYGLDINREKQYLVFRGTKSKEGFFARDFNINDSLSSHVGFLSYVNDNWVVFHVSNFKNKISDLKKDCLDQFFEPKNEEVFYGSLWEITVSDNFKNRVVKEIENFESKKVIFDKSFSLNDSTKLYCSEFIVKLLEKSDSINFKFNTHNRQLKGIYKTYFRKDSLKYYPVDVFQDNKRINLIREFYFKKS